MSQRRILAPNDRQMNNLEHICMIMHCKLPGVVNGVDLPCFRNWWIGWHGILYQQVISDEKQASCVYFSTKVLVVRPYSCPERRSSHEERCQRKFEQSQILPQIWLSAWRKCLELHEETWRSSRSLCWTTSSLLYNDCKLAWPYPTTIGRRLPFSWLSLEHSHYHR